MKICLTPLDNLARVLLSEREPGTVFSLAPGVYLMPGNWHAGAANGWCHLAAGCTIEAGDHSDRPVLRLDPTSAVRETDGKPRPDRDLSVIWCNGFSTGAESYFTTALRWLRIDANEAAFNRPGTPAWYTSGARMHNQSRVEECVIAGIRGEKGAAGTLNKDIESFALTSTGATSGSLWDSLRVDGLRGYASGFFLGCTWVPTMPPVKTWSRVNNCRVGLSFGAQLAFAANARTVFRDCSNLGGTTYGFYNDTGTTQDTVLDNCVLTGTQAAVSVRPQSTESVARVQIVGGTLSGARALEIDTTLPAGVQAEVDLHRVQVDATYLYAIRNPKARVRIFDCSGTIGAKRFRFASSPAPFIAGPETSFTLPEEIA